MASRCAAPESRKFADDVGGNVRPHADGQGLCQSGLRFGEHAPQGGGDLAARGEQGAVEPGALSRSAQLGPGEGHDGADALLGQVAGEVEVAAPPRRLNLAGEPERVALAEEGVLADRGQGGRRARRHQYAPLRRPPVSGATLHLLDL